MSRLRVLSASTALLACVVGTAFVAHGGRAAETTVLSCTPSWVDVPSPRVRGGELRGVAALSATDAWAVGGITRFDVDYGLVSAVPLIEHWDGTTWKRAEAPERGLLLAVAASSSRNVWAAGRPPDRGPSRGIIMRWNGRRWSNVAVSAWMPDVEGIATLGPRDVWAVGSTWDGDTSHGQVWHYDGARWARQLLVTDVWLDAVVAIAQNDVWAVGSRGWDRLAAFHWNGRAWKAFPQPRVETDLVGLAAVAAFASDDVWAGGGRHIEEMSDGAETPVVTHWNGTRWATVAPPEVESEIDGLAALASGQVVAVGTNGSDYYSNHGAGVFDARRSGGSWTVNAVGDGRALYGVAAVPGHGGGTLLAWAVGQLGSGETDSGGFPAHTVPLIRRYAC
jgi:hypothetical protein